MVAVGLCMLLFVGVAIGINMSKFAVIVFLVPYVLGISLAAVKLMKGIATWVPVRRWRSSDRV
jgi:hypothetical protein